MSEIDIAKSLFGGSGNIQRNSTRAPSNMAYVPTIGTTSTRYGTVQSIGENGSTQVILDGSDSPIYVTCETPVVQGQRVSVFYDNGTMSVNALSHFVEQVAEDKTSIMGQIGEIQASVDADIQEVKDSLDDFKATHSYTDAQIDTKFEEAEDTITANVTASIGDEFVTDAELEIAVGQIESTVSENYQSKTDAGTMQSNLQSQITQNADAITQEVTDRTTAVSGAVQESKAYTDTKADEITNVVMETVDDEMGQTYATKSEVSQTAEGLNLGISAALSAAENAQTDVASLTDVVADNSETVSNVNAYFDFGMDDSGNPLLTLGSSESEMKSEFSNRALSFKSNGNEVMRLEGSTSTVVANKIQSGSYQWVGEGDTFRLIYVGGD